MAYSFPRVSAAPPDGVWQAVVVARIAATAKAQTDKAGAAPQETKEEATKEAKAAVVKHKAAETALAEVNKRTGGEIEGQVFAGTLGVLLTVAAFGLFRIGGQALEALGHLPLRWGENNIDLLLELSLAASAPLVVWFTLWFYKRARNAEEGLVGYIVLSELSPSTP